MAKEHSVAQSIKAITKAIRAEASGTLTPEEKEKTINEAMDVVENGDFMTIAENADAAIVLQDQIAERQAMLADAQEDLANIGLLPEAEQEQDLENLEQ